MPNVESPPLPLISPISNLRGTRANLYTACIPVSKLKEVEEAASAGQIVVLRSSKFDRFKYGLRIRLDETVIQIRDKLVVSPAPQSAIPISRKRRVPVP